MGRGKSQTQAATAGLRSGRTGATGRVFIELSYEDQEVLTQKLFDVANDRDPIIGWEEPSDDDWNFSDDPYDNEPYPVRGNKADYADHPLLGLAQAIQWYTTDDVFCVDAYDDKPVQLCVPTDVNRDIFLAELDRLGISYSAE